jgi:hypothetical protein
MMATPEADSLCPRIFRYAAFSGDSDGVTATLHALEKLARLTVLAQRGVRADDCLVGDEELLAQLSIAVQSAAMYAHHMWREALANEAVA